MDIRDGRIYTQEEIDKLGDAFKKYCIPVNPSISQFYTRQIELTDLCPCESGLLFGDCCMRRSIDAELFLRHDLTGTFK